MILPVFALEAQSGRLFKPLAFTKTFALAASVIVALTISGLQAFAQIDILTSGGPAGSTETLVFKIFRSQQPIDVGEGAVVAPGSTIVARAVAKEQRGQKHHRA